MIWSKINIILIIYIFNVTHSKNVICGRGRSSRVIRIDAKESYVFKTQKGRRYVGSTVCTALYKLGPSCKAMKFFCSRSNLQNMDRKFGSCLKGDKLTVVTGGKPRKFCGRRKAIVTAKNDIKVEFRTDKKKHSSGANCRISCTSKKITSPPLPPGPCFCGLAKRTTKRDTRIVGGKVTEVNEYPWQVGLVDKGSNFIFCGASLISDRWVLTAAHCVHTETVNSVQVLLGEHDYGQVGESRVLRRNIDKIVIHPNYNDFVTNYDFALLKCSDKVNFGGNPHIRPVCLPTNQTRDYTTVTATVIGWGTTSVGGITSDQLREVDVKVISNSQCQSLGYPRDWITDKMLCAKVNGGGRDACQGDSGGPLFHSGGSGVKPGQNYEQIGIVSWGSSCAKDQYPGVYSRVTESLSWISSVTSGSWNTCRRI